MKLNEEKAFKIRKQILEKWDAGESYFYPLNYTDRDDVICFPQDYFLKDIGLKNLSNCLKKLKVEECYLLDEYKDDNKDFLISNEEIIPYNGLEKYYCDNSNEWIIYFSHENTITFGGKMIINILKSEWSNWKKVAERWSYSENPPIDGMIEVLMTIKEKINANTNLFYCGFDTVKELMESIDTDLNNLRYENIEYFEGIKNRFLPTVDFQELSIDNGWADEYIDLASKFDNCYQQWEQQSTSYIGNIGFGGKIKNWFKKNFK